MKDMKRIAVSQRQKGADIEFEKGLDQIVFGDVTSPVVSKWVWEPRPFRLLVGTLNTWMKGSVVQLFEKTFKITAGDTYTIYYHIGFSESVILV